MRMQRWMNLNNIALNLHVAKNKTGVKWVFECFLLVHCECVCSVIIMNKIKDDETDQFWVFCVFSTCFQRF